MKHLLIVFIGGGLGTVARFLVGKFLPYSGKGFPWNTFCANLLGCLFIGFLIGYFHRNSNENESSLVLFATVGFVEDSQLFLLLPTKTYHLLNQGISKCYLFTVC